MRLWSVSRLRQWSAGLRKFTVVQQFFAATAAAVGVNMLAMGYWAENRIYESAVTSIAETASLYLQGYLAPHLHHLAATGTLSEEDRHNIDALLRSGNLVGRVDVIKLWRLDGSLLYSTDGSAGDAHPKDELLRAIAGQVAVDFKGHGGWSPFRSPRVEIYAPVSLPGSNVPVAVGEFYEKLDYLDRTLDYYRVTLWIMVLVFSISIVGTLYMIVLRANRTIVRQRQELVGHLEEMSRLARRNDHLRRIAEKARRNASIANDRYLASIGSDLHDGPMQILTLALLRMSAIGQELSADCRSILTETEELVRKSLNEMRALAAGLVLPEIEHISLQETVRLAALRHESLTGTRVDYRAEALPDNCSTSVKVCAYRIVQEALGNAFKHAQGRGQVVSVRMDDGEVDIRISNETSASAGVAQSPPQYSLGLRGLINRVKALRGTVTFTSRSNGALVHARIPIGQP